MINNRLAAGLLLTGVLLISPPALAGTTYLPAFTQAQEVYLDPLLANHSDAPVVLAGLQAQLKELEQEHGLEFAFVAVQNTNPSDTTSQDNEAAAQQGLTALLNRWGGVTEFPKDNYVVIYWLRRADNTRKGSFLADAGSSLQEYGVDKHLFTALSFDLLPKYMPADPTGAAVAMFRGVNTKITKAKEEAAFFEQLPGLLGKVFGGVVAIIAGSVIGIAIGQEVNRRRAVDELLEETYTRFKQRAARFGEVMLGLDERFAILMTEHPDLTTQWVGQAKQLLDSLRANYAELLLHYSVVQDVLAKAESLVKQRRKLYDLLNTEVFEYDGDRLPLEKASLFQGLTQRYSLTLPDLLNRAEELFNKIRVDQQHVYELLGADAELAAAKAELSASAELLATLDFLNPSAAESLAEQHNNYLGLQECSVDPAVTMSHALQIKEQTKRLSFHTQMLKELWELNQTLGAEFTELITELKPLIEESDDPTTGWSSDRTQQLLAEHRLFLSQGYLARARDLVGALTSQVDWLKGLIEQTKRLPQNLDDLRTQVRSLNQRLANSTLPKVNELQAEGQLLAQQVNNLSPALSQTNLNAYLEAKGAVDKLADRFNASVALHEKAAKRLRTLLYNIRCSTKHQKAAVKSSTRQAAQDLEQRVLNSLEQPGLYPVQLATALEIEWEDNLKQAEREVQEYERSRSSYSSSSSSSSYSSSDYSGSSYGSSSSDYGGGSYGGGDYGGGSY